jgi:hypothetical protein
MKNKIYLNPEWKVLKKQLETTLKVIEDTHFIIAS